MNGKNVSLRLTVWTVAACFDIAIMFGPFADGVKIQMAKDPVAYPLELGFVGYFMMGALSALALAAFFAWLFDE